MLSSIVKASLCVFTRPMVEISFSMMNDIVDLCSGRTEIDTYSALMSVKYQLKSAGDTSSAERFSKILLMKSYVIICKLLVSNIRKGYSVSKKQC